MKTIRNVFLIVTGLVLAVHLVFAALNSQAIASVTIQLLPDATEHKDKSLFGIGKKEVLPDYEVVIYGDGTRTWNLGFKKDTSAKERLEFLVADPIPTRHVQTIAVHDKDKFETDVLDTTPYKGSQFESNRFQYTVETVPTFSAFMRYFFDTPLGIAISAGIIIGLAAVIILSAM